MRLSRSSAIAGASLLAVTGTLGSVFARRILTHEGLPEPRTSSRVRLETDAEAECREAWIPAFQTQQAHQSVDAATWDSRRLELRGFTYADRPIHPAAVMELSGVLADPLPTIAAIDLEGFTRSNAVSGSVVSEEDGTVWLHDEERCGTGCFGYTTLGCSPTGTWVLWTVSNGGGTGYFENLLFVRLEKDVVTTNTGRRDRIVLRSVGEYGLGDRDDGGVRFEGTQVFIGKSRYRDADVVLTID